MERVPSRGLPKRVRAGDDEAVEGAFRQGSIRRRHNEDRRHQGLEARAESRSAVRVAPGSGRAIQIRVATMASDSLLGGPLASRFDDTWLPVDDHRWLRPSLPSTVMPG